MARPTKLTPERSALICRMISAGNWRETAAAAAGIEYATLRLWELRGKHAKEGEARRSDKPYIEFFEALSQAEGEAEVATVIAWQNAIPKDWRAAAEFLRKRYPARWSGPLAGRYEIDDEALRVIFDVINRNVQDPDTIARIRADFARLQAEADV